MAQRGSATERRPLAGWRPDEIGDAMGLRLVASDRACELRCYPRDDRAFEADARRVMMECRALTLGWDDFLAQFRCGIARLYPNAHIQPRNRLAARNNDDRLLYCYRDGRLVAAAMHGTVADLR
jgi:hypothetical protein